MKLVLAVSPFSRQAQSIGSFSAGAVLLITATMNAQAQYNYSTLSVPGASVTYASGISGNNIVGSYGNGSADLGFLYNGSTYTTLSLPGAPDGIDGNNIVGSYSNGSGDTYGFLATPVPEPSVLGLLAVGAAALLVRRRKQRIFKPQIKTI
jgi:hypothetical protein